MKAFYEVSSNDFIRQLSDKVKNEIENKGKEYILGVDEEEFKKYLIDKYILEPLVIDFESENVGEPLISKKWVESFYSRGEKYEVDAYTFTVKYSFTGASELFRVCPSQFVMTTEEININEHNKTVSFSFTITSLDSIEFYKKKEDYHNRAFRNYEKDNRLAEAWRIQLEGIVFSYFKSLMSGKKRF